MSGPLGFDTGSINSHSAAMRQLAQMLPCMQSRAGQLFWALQMRPCGHGHIHRRPS